ncbi:MAG TPA: efflux RND transporter periplasmic adaptor subunit [Chthonomonadaceae bacterium]|nr:efflux RND transporter periplasmic adaptor subunit [Chthonomonadaceae bacterium]
MDGRTNTMRQLVMSVAVIAAVSATGFALTRKPAKASHDAPPTLSEAIEISRRGEQVAGIEIARVTQEPLSSMIHATGQVSYPSDQTVKISPRLQGRVRNVYVRVGDHVTAGQTLAELDSVDAAAAVTAARQSENKLRLAALTLDRNERLYRLGTPEVTAAQAALAQAHTASLLAREALDRTKQQAEIGEFVDPPIEAARNSVIQARAALVQAQSDLAQAQRDHDRKAKLVEIGVSARSDLEASTNVLEKATAAVTSDQDTLKITEQALDREQKAFKAKLYEQQQVRAAEAAYRQAQVQESGAQTALRLAKAAIQTNIMQARSDYLAAKNDAESARHVDDLLGHPAADGTVRVLAPISGVITDRQVSPGQMVDQSQMTPWQMFVVSNTDRAWIDADVFEKDIASIAPGQPVSVHVNAAPGKEFRGAVLRIAPTVDRTSRAIKVRVEIPNSHSLLKDGMYASVTIVAAGDRRVLTVPASAVQHDGESDFVYLSKEGKYIRRKVEIGAHLIGRYVVTSGVSAGDSVVSRGAIFLDGQANGG